MRNLIVAAGIDPDDTIRALEDDGYIVTKDPEDVLTDLDDIELVEALKDRGYKNIGKTDLDPHIVDPLQLVEELIATHCEVSAGSLKRDLAANHTKVSRLLETLSWKGFNIARLL